VTLRAFVLVLTGCLAQSSPPPPAAPRPTSGFGQLVGYFVSPNPGETLTISFLRGEQMIETVTAPSGGFDMKLPEGPIRLTFATAAGPITGCDTTIDVKGDTQTIVNQAPPPTGCNLWVRFDKQHPLEQHRGARTDVKTEFGTYDGYDVLACTEPDRGALFYIVGGGTERPPENSDRKHDAAFNNWIEDKRRDIAAALKPMSSGAGFGMSCRAGTAATISVYASDYRQVDEIITRLGGVIREQRLGVGFTITMMPIAVLL
jgi:hypothetical protein